MLNNTRLILSDSLVNGEDNTYGCYMNSAAALSAS